MAFLGNGHPIDIPGQENDPQHLQKNDPKNPRLPSCSSTARTLDFQRDMAERSICVDNSCSRVWRRRLPFLVFFTPAFFKSRSSWFLRAQSSPPRPLRSMTVMPRIAGCGSAMMKQSCALDFGCHASSRRCHKAIQKTRRPTRLLMTPLQVFPREASFFSTVFFYGASNSCSHASSCPPPPH